jgi:hypothetical protein
MRRSLLFIGSTLLITGFFLLKKNRVWFNDRIITYYREFPQQRNRMKEEDRLKDRFANYYTLSTQIAAAAATKSPAPDFLLLMPSTAYFKSKGIEFHVPEPVIFYYFTQLKTVWPNSPNAINANWYVHVLDGKITINSVYSKQSLQDTLTEFNKFDISL